MRGQLLVVALIALSLVSVAFAARPMQRMPTIPVTGAEENNAMATPVMTQARAVVVNQGVIQKLRERFAHRIKDFNAILRRAIQRRAEIARAVRVSRTQINRWKKVTARYMRFVQRVRETAARYRLKLQEWYRARKMFEEGNISEEEYFAKTKDMILAAIDAVTERLESLKENNMVSDTNEIDTAITQLENLRAEVEAAQDLDTLRTLYHDEVLPTLREYLNKVFFHFYMMGTLDAAQSIVMRLDVAAARLARYVDRAKELGIYDENMDARVTAIFAEIDAVKAELNTLQTEVEQNTLSPREYIAKLGELKRDIYNIYKEIVALIKDYARKYAQQIRERLKVHAEVNAMRNAARVRAEVNKGAAAEVNA